MLDSLSSKLRAALDRISGLSVVDREAVEDAARDIQRALLSADVDVHLVLEITESIKKKAFADLPSGVSRREHLVRVVYEELTSIMGAEKAETEIMPKKILMAGLFGSGKTSTTAKLARFYKNHGLKVIVVCADTFRPAAYEQLQQLSKKIDVHFYGEKGERSAEKIVRNALREKADVYIVDSSGRNALDEELAEEIKAISHALQPDERILVVPADIGQVAKQQASAFHRALGITDVIVTKMDATAKGGGALTACAETGARIKFITTGERPEDIDPYDPKKFVARLLGFPDLETLLEKAKAHVDEDKAKKMVTGEFDIEEFYSQIEGMQKMGPMSQMLEMAGLGKLAGKADLGKQEEKMKKWRYVIQSMTRYEKAHPDVINSSRVRRIATGSGTSESDVRELLSNYLKVKKMMKQISPAKLKRGGLSSLFRKFGMR